MELTLILHWGFVLLQTGMRNELPEVRKEPQGSPLGLLSLAYLVEVMVDGDRMLMKDRALVLHT